MWQPKVHYSVNSTLPLVAVSQINPLHAHHLISRRSVLILSSHLRVGFWRCLFPSGFLNKIPCGPRLSPVRATCLAHLILGLIIRIILGTTNYEAAHCAAFSSLLLLPPACVQHNCQHVPSNTLSLCYNNNNNNNNNFFFSWRYNPHWGLYFTAL